MNELYQQVVSAQSNPIELQKIHRTCIGQKMKMDKFFSMYLDKFDRKMDPDNTKTPIWDLYKKKLNEYSELNRSLKAAEYFMKKQANV
jgi:hypothetical protein